MVKVQQPIEGLYGTVTAGDAFGELEKVLGNIPDRYKHDYAGEQSRTHGDLTELLMSRASPVVTQQVTGLLLKTYVSPITTFLMPIRQLGPYESINFKWMEINFDQGLAPQIETEGLARLYTHNKTRRGARLVRRGVAVKVEEGFFLTPEGREEWGQQIEQLATIIQRTNEYDAFINLLQTPLRDSPQANRLGGAFNHVYGAQSGMSRYDRLILQRDWYSIVNKAEDSKGFNNLVGLMKTVMTRNGVDPNAIVVPPNLVSVFFGASNDLWSYSDAGPSSAQNRAMADELPTDGFRSKEIQGLRVVDTYVQRSTVGGYEGAGDLLTVPTQIGEWYPMSTNDFLVDEELICNFKGKMRDIKIFNEDQSRFVPVSFESAIENCLRWDKYGNPDVVEHQKCGDDIFVNEDDGTVARFWYQVRPKWWGKDNTFTTAERVAKSLAGCHATTDWHEDRLQKFINTSFDDQNQPKPQAPEKLPKSDGSFVDKNDPNTIQDYKDALEAINKTFEDVYTNLEKKFRANLNDASEFNNVVKGAKEFYLGTKKFKEAFTDSGLSDSEAGLWDTALNLMNCSERLFMIFFLCSPINKNTLVKMHRMNVYLPFDFVLARPYMTYNTSSAIMMLAGRETGEIVVGQQRFQMTSNIADRTLYGNFFYYGRAIVYKDRNVLVAPNIFIQDYVKGNNTTFIQKSDLNEIKEVSGIQNSSHSILAIMTMAGDDVTSSNIIDIRGRNPDLQLPGKRSNDPHYATHGYYTNLFQLDPRALSDPSDDYQDYEDLNVQSNSICFLGHTKNYKGEVLYQNTGHLGPHTYDGVNLSRKPGYYAAVRNGAATGQGPF